MASSSCGVSGVVIVTGDIDSPESLRSGVSHLTFSTCLLVLIVGLIAKPKDLRGAFIVLGVG